MKCVNTNSQDFKDLLGLTGLSVLHLEGKIDTWQTNNNTDEFPTVKQLFGNSISEIKNQLGIKSKMLSNDLGLLANRVKIYNNRNNTSHSFSPVRQFGTDYYNIKFCPNFNSTYRHKEARKSELTSMEKSIDRFTKQSTKYLSKEEAINEEALKYQEDRNDYISSNGEYYNLNKIYSSGSNKSIDNKITNFLNKINVNLEEIDAYDSEGNPLNFVAKADVLGKIISVVKSKQDITTLPEEASHFFVELLGKDNSLYLKMLKDIENFDEYQEVLTTYSEAYDNDIEKLKKEAIGKVISKIIVGEKPKASISALSGFKNLLNNIFKFLGVKFIKFDTVNYDNLIESYKQSAEAILNGDVSQLQNLEKFQSGDFKDSDFFYELDKKKKKSVDEKFKNQDIVLDPKTNKYILNAVKYLKRVSELTKKVSEEYWSGTNKKQKDPNT